MQRLFYEDTEWRTPWMPRVLPKIVDLAAACPERTVFTRFIPAERAGEGEGSWRRYYRRWPAMTLEKLGRDMIELAPPLQRFVPPAAVLDKRVYSPWLGTGLHAALRGQAIDTFSSPAAKPMSACLPRCSARSIADTGLWLPPTRSAVC
jgi:nicotinamidase-related amidase